MAFKLTGVCKLRIFFISPLLLLYINQSCILAIKIICGKSCCSNDSPCIQKLSCKGSFVFCAMDKPQQSGAALRWTCILLLGMYLGRKDCISRKAIGFTPGSQGHDSSFALGGRGRERPLVRPLVSFNMENYFLAHCVVI